MTLVTVANDDIPVELTLSSGTTTKIEVDCPALYFGGFYACASDNSAGSSLTLTAGRNQFGNFLLLCHSLVIW